MNVAEEFGVLFKEFLGDGLNAEGFFNLRQRRVCAVIGKQVEEARLRGVAAFAFADDIGEAPRRGETRLYANLAAVGLDSRVLHADIRKAPTAFRGGDEGNERRVFLIPLLEVIGNEVADGGARALQLGIRGQMHNEHVERFAVRGRVCAEPLVTSARGP